MKLAEQWWVLPHDFCGRIFAGKSFGSIFFHLVIIPCVKTYSPRTVFSRRGGVSVVCAAITFASLVAVAAPALSVEEPNDSLAVVQRQSVAPTGEAPAARFTVTFNQMTTLDQAKRMNVLDNIVEEFSSDASFVRQMFDGSYVVELNPPVPAERIPSLRGTLESKAEIAYADIDRVQYSPLLLPHLTTNTTSINGTSLTSSVRTSIRRGHRVQTVLRPLSPWWIQASLATPILTTRSCPATT